MRTDAAARLGLSLLVEPGDPRLRDVLELHTPARVLEAVLTGESIDGTALPPSWCERADNLERARDVARERAVSAGLRWMCPGDAQWPERVADLDHVEPLQDLSLIHISEPTRRT